MIALARLAEIILRIRDAVSATIRAILRMVRVTWILIVGIAVLFNSLMVAVFFRRSETRLFLLLIAWPLARFVRLLLLLLLLLLLCLLVANEDIYSVL